MPLELDLRIGGLGVCEPGSRLGPRVLSGNEFLWVVSGSGDWLVDGTRILIPEDGMVLAREGMHDCITWDRHRQSQVAYLHFGLRAGAETLPPPAHWPPMLDLAESQDILRPTFRHIVWLMEQRPDGWREQVHDMARCMLRAFARGQYTAGRVHSASLPAVTQRAVEYIVGEWRDQPVLRLIGVEELRSAAGCSIRNLHRVFHDAFGRGPAETMRMARLEIAALILRHSSTPLADIAGTCGFSDAFHFSHAFKSAYGVSPGGFRSDPTRARALQRREREQLQAIIGRVVPHVLF